MSSKHVYKEKLNLKRKSEVEGVKKNAMSFKERKKSNSNKRKKNSELDENEEENKEEKQKG